MAVNTIGTARLSCRRAATATELNAKIASGFMASRSLAYTRFFIGRIMEVIRAGAPNTIVLLTADNGAWQDAYPDTGTTPFRGEKGTAFEAVGACRA